MELDDSDRVAFQVNYHGYDTIYVTKNLTDIAYKLGKRNIDCTWYYSRDLYQGKQIEAGHIIMEVPKEHGLEIAMFLQEVEI